MRRVTVTAAAIAVTGVLAVVAAQQTGFRRTALQQEDLAIPEHEAVTAMAELDPGASSGQHRHSGDEVGYVLDGTLTLEQDGKPTMALSAGEAFLIPAGTVHNAVNTSPATVRVLVTYVAPKGQTLTTAVGAPDAEVASAEVASAGFFTEEQATRGGAVYDERCAACHGEDLMGTGFAPPLTDEMFIGHWVDRNVGELFVRLKETMPADSPASLSDDVYADLVAFLLSSNGHPVGQQPLSTDPVELEQIVIHRP